MVYCAYSAAYYSRIHRLWESMIQDKKEES